MEANRTAAASSAACARPGGSIGWVFLDRDGTLNVSPAPGEYIERPEQLQLLAGAGEAVALLNRAGVWTGVVTNQRGVALGRMTIAQLDAVHERLRELLARHGAWLDAIYACPHAEGTCDCRKPKPGLLLAAAESNPTIDFTRAAIVGDSASDMLAGRSLGLTTILIAAPDGDRTAPDGDRPRQPPSDSPARAHADHVVSDLLQAARLVTAGALEGAPADIPRPRADG